MERIMRQMTRETKLYPYQEALLAAIIQRRARPIGYDYGRVAGRRYSSDLLTTSKMLKMKKDEILCICTPHGNVKFQCISNDLM